MHECSRKDITKPCLLPLAIKKQFDVLSDLAAGLLPRCVVLSDCQRIVDVKKMARLGEQTSVSMLLVH
jgi:hypothetical protein